MHHSRRKSFDWYGLKQHFSIRKYHFGAASVLLGMSIALGTGTQVVQAAETVTTPESTSVASSTSATESTTSETSTETATSSSSERTVEIGYIVKYATEDDTLANASVETVSVTTTETIAKATVSVTAVVPEGYELASGQSATVSQEVTENGQNIVTVKVVKKVEASATVSSPTTTSTTVATASSTTRAAASPTPTTPTTPTTVEEAKKVLEQVTSEAEVLANEGNRIVATDTTTDTSALKAAAAATKLAATDATSVLQDTVATLDALNTQINAVRSNVDALVLELRKYYPDGEITAVLNTAAGTPVATTIDVTNPRSIYYAQNGVWEIPDPAKAANSGLPVADQQATITEADRNYPDGYNGDQEADRDTFLILNLDTVAGYGDGQNFNDWVKHNYYITFSVSTNAAERASEDVVYAKLVEKTDNGNNVVRTIKLAPGVANNFEELKVLEGDTAHKTTYSFVYNVQKNGGTTRTITINNSNGVNKNAFLYSKLEPKRVGERFTTASASVTGSTTQTTSYFVKENADTGRPRELLAKYTQTGGLIGDKFSIAGAIDFDNYELIKSELPSVTSGVLASDYIVGTQNLQVQPNNNEVRVVTITGTDGSIQQQLYMLDPNNPDWAKFYKSNMNKATLSDLKDYFKLMFTSEVLKPGTYNTKEGTFSAKFYEAKKLVLENTIVQVLDENGNVLGTLSDDKSTITTNAGTTISVASATDSLVKATDSLVEGTDEIVYLLNYLKVYKTDTNGNYVDAEGNVLDPIKWHVDPPSNPFVKDVYAKKSFDTDTVTIATGPLDANSYPEAIWYFGYNYKTANEETRLDDKGPNQGNDTRWDLGGKELGMRNSNTKNEQHARYWYTEKGGVEVYYITSDGRVLTDFTTSDGKNVADKVTIVGHGDTDSAYDTTSVRYPTITAADGTVYYYKQIDTTAKNLHPVVDDKTDTDYRSNEKIDAEKGTIKSDTVKQLTYVYEKAGNVNINYVDTEGTPLQASVADVTDGKPGSDYNTAQEGEKPEIIKTKDGKTYKLAPANTYNVGTVSDDSNLTAVGNGKAKGIDDVTGTVEAGVTKEITYVYKEVKGNVVVKYVDVNGNPISGTADKGVDGKEKEVASEVEDTPLSSTTNTGNGYDTTDNRPNTITTADGKVYKLVPAATQGNEAGDIVEGTTTVTYVYELLQGDVIVHYVDTEGNTIADDVTDQVITDTGTDYDTRDNKPEKITNDQTGEVYYILPKDEVKAGDKETGKVVEGTTEVTYIYEKAGSVNVNYVDTEGNVIKTKVADVTDGKSGSDYDTVLDNKLASVSVDGKLYRLVPAGDYKVGTVGAENNLTTVGNGKATGIDATTGKVEAGKTKEITYVYKEVKGDVVVEYYDTEGNTIAKTEVDTPTTSVDTPYETYDHKPATITVVEKDGSETVYYYKKVKDTSAPEKGDVVEGTTTVQYVYEKAGNVIVHYITEDGTVIKATVTDEENAEPGKSYDTTDNKPTTITTEDGSRYVLIPSKTIGTENGTVEGGKTIEITYVYKKVANWIPQIPGVPEGQEPKVPYPFDPNNPDVPVTPTPDTVIPNVPGYTPVDPKTNEPLKPVDPTDPGKGYVPPTPDDSSVDTPIPYVQNGNVVVNYVDENGNVLKTPVNDETDAPAGKSYDTTDNKPTEIVTEDGSRYVLIPSKTIGTENGTVEGGKTIEITYVYKKVANWVPQIPGVPEGQEPKVPYPFDPTNPDVPVTPTPDTVIPNVPGYTPVDPKTNEPLKPVDPTDPGKGYVPPTPDDSGVDTPIPYVQNGNVVVNYVDENGNVLKTPVNDETDAPAGKSYDTTDNKPVEIVTEDGTRYVLIPSKIVGSETGTVEGGKTTEVTYVYRKVETPAKKVVTNHVDEDGNPIAPQEEGTTPNKSIPGYEFTGKTVTDPDGNTTHIYRKVTKVVTNHVDEDGNPIAPQEEGTTPNKSIPGYEFTGKTVTDPDGNTTHIYRKVTKVVTNHVDEDGNPIAPQEEGTTPNKSIPGYEFTGKTYTDGDGNTYHVYRKASNPVAPKPQAPVAPTTAKAGAAQLPNTGEASSSATVLGAAMLVAALALVGKRRRNNEE